MEKSIQFSILQNKQLNQEFAAVNCKKNKLFQEILSNSALFFINCNCLIHKFIYLKRLRWGCVQLCPAVCSSLCKVCFYSRDNEVNVFLFAYDDWVLVACVLGAADTCRCCSLIPTPSAFLCPSG